jgi:ABC-type Zn uptake system ZnuABC Zn-binding protein ZnuA
LLYNEIENHYQLREENFVSSSRHLPVFLFLTALFFGLAACGPAPAAGENGKLKVVATTTIVGDVVRQIGGDQIDLTVLLPVGSDPHSFEPTPQDAARVADAQLIFANGAGLEEFLTPLLKNAGSQAEVVPVSEGIELLASQEVHDEGSAAAESHSGDPHTWFDPNNVMIWVKNIEAKLSLLDPAHAQQYGANAAAYTGKLKELDGWIQEQVTQIPVENRKLVTDHASFTYFASRYGFTQVGAIIPAYSSMAQPSAQDLAALEDAVRAQGVKAVFVSEAANPAQSERIAQDTGVQVVKLYNGALSAPDGPAGTYLDFMRFDVTEIVKALK